MIEEQEISQQIDQLRDKETSLAISREAFFAGPEAQEAMRQIGINPAAFREHLKKVERDHLFDEFMRLDWSRTIRREISPEEWRQHKTERQERVTARRMALYNTESEAEREEREFAEEMAAHDRLVAEEQRLQAIIDAAGAEETPEVGVARETLELIDAEFEKGTTVTELLNILERSK